MTRLVIIQSFRHCGCLSVCPWRLVWMMRSSGLFYAIPRAYGTLWWWIEEEKYAERDVDFVASRRNPFANQCWPRRIDPWPRVVLWSVWIWCSSAREPWVAMILFMNRLKSPMKCWESIIIYGFMMAFDYYVEWLPGAPIVRVETFKEIRPLKNESFIMFSAAFMWPL